MGMGGAELAGGIRWITRCSSHGGHPFRMPLTVQWKLKRSASPHFEEATTTSQELDWHIEVFWSICRRSEGGVASWLTDLGGLDQGHRLAAAGGTYWIANFDLEHRPIHRKAMLAYREGGGRGSGVGAKSARYYYGSAETFSGVTDWMNLRWVARGEGKE
ncbi:hypothetical protein An03g00630 [Aspergillus niger]|uniref:Uncharacterized protein n=2 Tax=Aspergillus niger TaxID=5061 RepID=A2QFS8_ASPNC|nr:hypothetical protein An03g00630 [Aspergillus niger]CAK38038.1 hypothetical protein An03g00630 [Aspergillus niger]